MITEMILLVTTLLLIAGKEDGDGPPGIGDRLSEIDMWLQDVLPGARAGDGATIYPDKLSLKSKKTTVVEGIAALKLGRADALRGAGYQLPMNPIWSIGDAEMVLIISTAGGDFFTQAKSLIAGIWKHLDSYGWWVQTSLSTEHGFQVIQPPDKMKKSEAAEATKAWIGRPVRASGAYVVGATKEDVL